MSEVHEARMELASWFVVMLDDLDADQVDDPDAIEMLKAMIAQAFTDWRIITEYGPA
jgi:hypothetical protein